MVAVTVPVFLPCDRTGQQTLSEGRALIWDGLGVFAGTLSASMRTHLHSLGIWGSQPWWSGKELLPPPPPPHPPSPHHPVPPFWN